MVFNERFWIGRVKYNDDVISVKIVVVIWITVQIRDFLRIGQFQYLCFNSTIVVEEYPLGKFLIRSNTQHSLIHGTSLDLGIKIFQIDDNYRIFCTVA